MRVSNIEDIGVIARQRRQELHISQVDLASRAGVTRQWLTRFERGNPEVSLSKVFAVLRELDLKVRVDAVNDPETRRTSAVFQIPRIATPEIKIPSLNFNVGNVFPAIKTSNMFPNIKTTDIFPNIKIANMMPNIKVGDILTEDVRKNIIETLRAGGVPPLSDPEKLAHVKDRIKAIEADRPDRAGVDE